jgi:hypothetical protein
MSRCGCSGPPQQLAPFFCCCSAPLDGLAKDGRHVYCIPECPSALNRFVGRINNGNSATQPPTAVGAVLCSSTASASVCAAALHCSLRISNQELSCMPRGGTAVSLLAALFWLPLLAVREYIRSAAIGGNSCQQMCATGALPHSTLRAPATPYTFIVLLPAPQAVAVTATHDVYMRMHVRMLVCVCWCHRVCCW